MHLDEGLPQIHADSTLLRRAIENLLLNAMAAMPTGGVLMLRTTHDESNVSLEVADTGSGLTPEETRHLFTPYYTANHHSAGLGLAIARSLTNLHGGSMRLRSKLGTGTVVCITLPRGARKPEAEVTALPWVASGKAGVGLMQEKALAS